MSALDTRFTRTFDLTAPIVQGPMGGVAGPTLVAAVAESGALGMLPVWFLPVDAARRAMEATRRLTARPFAVNLRADLVQLEHIAAAIDTGIGLIHLFWGDPSASMAPLRAGGARMIATVWDPDSARRAVDAGASALIAQGVEAGGHVMGTTPLPELLRQVRQVAGEVPIAAAGGLADADDVARMLDGGADAALLGTRFAATAESDAHDAYKKLLLDASGDDTVRSTCFDGMWPDAPHRTLRNSTFDAWERAGRPPAGRRPGEGDIVLHDPDGQPYPRYSMVLPTRDDTGDPEAAALYAGMGVGRINDLPAAHELVSRIVADLVARRRD